MRCAGLRPFSMVAPELRLVGFFAIIFGSYVTGGYVDGKIELLIS